MPREQRPLKKTDLASRLGLGLMMYNTRNRLCLVSAFLALHSTGVGRVSDIFLPARLFFICVCRTMGAKNGVLVSLPCSLGLCRWVGRLF